MKAKVLVLLLVSGIYTHSNAQIAQDASSTLKWNRVTNRAGEDFHPSFSPDGKYILFDSQDSMKVYHVMLYAMATPEREAVIVSQGDHPTWFPDSKQILFPSATNGVVQTFKINIDGSNRIQLTQDGGFPLSVSPDGKSLVYLVRDTKHWSICATDVEGKLHKRLTNEDADDYSPIWSNDSKRLMFTSEKQKETDVMVMSVKNPKPVEVLTFKGNTSVAKWSPDGKSILFVSDESGGDEIYIADEDGKNIRRLTNLAGPKFWASFTPNGKQIYFVCNDEAEAEIYLIDVDGKNLKRLTNNHTREAAPSISSDGTKMVFVSSVGKDLEIFYTDIRTLR